MKRLTTDEIIQLGLRNRATLIYMVRNGLIVAYDDKDKPVDLKKKELMFLDIQRLCEPKTEIKKVKKREIDSGCITGGTWDPRKASYDRVYYVDEEKEYRRINIIQDQHPTQAGMITNGWIDWDILHQMLSIRDFNDRPINITFSQEQAIMKGWNSDRIFDCIKMAEFNESEIINQEQPNEDGPISGAQPVEYPSHDYHPLMSEELRICNEAWRYLYSDKTPTEGKQIRKDQIKKWLKKHHPEYSANSIDRMTTVINPHKLGGATPSR